MGNSYRKALVISGIIFCLFSFAWADSVSRVYWTQWSGSSGVYRANADGSEIEQVISETFNSLDGLAIDPVENKLYISTSYHLLRCNLDGSGLETVISGGKAFDFFCLAIDAANRKIYWSDWIQGGPTQGMRRANLDGTSIETIFEGMVWSKAIDPEAGKIYWNASDAIYKSDLDGSNRIVVLPDTFGGHLGGLALDVKRNKMYFTTWESGGIWRANMDGTDVERLSDDKTNAIAVDSDGGKLYWSSWAYSWDQIKRANLDGSDEEVVCPMSGCGNSIALEIIPEPTSPPVAVAGPNQIVYARIDGIAEVELDGSDSNDADGDELTYYWTWTIDANIYEANGVNPIIELPIGVHTIELIVNDGLLDSELDEVVITVVGPMELLDTLGQAVSDLGLQKGVANSLLAKLDTALQKLEDDNENNDTAAVNLLETFINAVQAQSGKKISEADADFLITAAQEIIELLSD